MQPWHRSEPARTEAPGTVLGWMMHEIGRQPEVEVRIHAELAAALGGRLPTHEDLPALAYLDRVITEVLRLRTPPVFMRRTDVRHHPGRDSQLRTRKKICV
ncbi:cytochrome P450 [Inquilinus limosus]|uniref:Cytochrome P450 n=1 Tax=Inquilinus limosus MP06 TaxID=1398085 RepID=A0A0A0D3B0_9PROT|nr:cytochrome P450 [Inquilinus limosus]KGM32569.1 hypothetical protein P409_20625 [Inquilinus limosus MP06]